MTERETIQRAAMYLERLSEGINPLNGAVIPEGEVVREERIIRCLRYAAEKLAAANVQNEEKTSAKHFFILDVQLEALEPSKLKLSTTNLVEKINRVTEENESGKFQTKWILDWLTEQGLLETRGSRRFTTESGELLGIVVDKVTGPAAQIPVPRVSFSTEAQLFVFEHLREMIPQKQAEKTAKARGERTSKRRASFFITDLQKGQLAPLEQDCSISQLCAVINSATAENETYKFKASWVNRWLIEIGMLEETDGKKRATPEGNELGITSALRVKDNGEEYIANSYTPEAQGFILDNIDAILAFAADNEA